MPKKVQWVTKPCIICGTPVSRVPSQMLKVACCSRKCSSAYQSQNMRKVNSELNSVRMTEEVKKKLSKARFGKGSGKSYPKLNGRHLHRTIAEQVIGRKLLPGEIVHHIDENKQNYAPENLRVFASQAEHAEFHAMLNSVRDLL